jgi:colanic acid biosynthesis glycosyl transferase WcaI
VSESFLLVTQYFPPERGAAQVRLGAITSELARRGHAVEVVTALPNYPTGRIFPGWRRVPVRSRTEGGCRVTRVWVWAAMGSGPGRIANYLSFGVMSLLGLLRSRPARWVVVEYPTLFGALPAVVWARLRRRRVAVIVADLWLDAIVGVGALGEGPLVSVLRRAEQWMFRRSDAVTVVTEGVRDAVLAKGVDPARTVWLPNGADTTMFAPGPADPSVRARAGVPDGVDLFLYAGTHGYVHGLDVVLDAADLLRDEPVCFLLVGGGSEKPDLEARAAALGLDNVRFADPVPPEEVADLLRAATAGLATVRAGDAYRAIRSAKMLPTMASGRPVIYSGDDEGSRLVADVGAGLVTPAGDAAALADAVRRLRRDPEEAGALGAAGRRWVEEHASWRRLVGDWLDELAALPGPAVRRAGR